MKKRHAITIASCAGLLMALGLVLIGCELFQPTDVDNYFEQNPYPSKGRDKENPGDLIIDPTAATVEWIGEKVVFTVDKGNEPFEWRVAESAHGSITRMDNDRQAVYKCKTLEPNTVIAEDANGRTIAAPINTVIGDLQIVGGNVTIPAGSGTVVGFVAVGGVPPYDWKITFSSLATVAESGPDDENCTYTETGGPGATGTNLLIVVDQLSNVDQVSIIHN